MSDKKERVFTNSEWRKTPYSGTTSGRTEQGISRLLDKYGCENFGVSRCRGPHGRKAVMVDFELNGRVYNIGSECLNVPDVDEDKLIRQAERAVFYFLKSTLEMADLFFPAEHILCGFLMLGNGGTVYEALKPHMGKLPKTTGAGFGRLMLGPAPGE